MSATSKGRANMTVEKLNRQRVLDLLDALTRSDLDTALSHCTDDVDFLTHALIDVLPHLGPRRGKAELRKLWSWWTAATPRCAIRCRTS